MAGILDKKSRVIDAILTVEGRRRMAEGTYSISYATFTDEGVVYQPDSLNGHVDPTEKIYLESRNLPQDEITFSADDEGKIVPFRAQNINLTNSGSIVPGLDSQAKFLNGRLEIFQYIHGYSVKTRNIIENNNDDNKGFLYSDHSGTTGSILIKSNLTSGEISSSLHPPVCWIGTKGGCDSITFASSICNGIKILSSFGGPLVVPNLQFDTVFIDSNLGSLTGSRLESIGTLSTPLILTPPAVGGKIVSGEIDEPSFSSQIQGILTSSFDNFSNQYTLSSIDRLFLDDKFSFSTNEITFDISKISDAFIKTIKDSTPSLNSINSLFQDKKLSYLDNFLYLPPIVKVSDTKVPDKSKIENLTPYLLGNYPSWGDNEKEQSYADLYKEIQLYDTTVQPVRILESSKKNRLIGQFFEVSNGVVSKLDVIDRGSMSDNKHVFFIGKTYIDNRGTTCFVNIFTLIFSELDGENEVVG